ncbi:MAG: 3-deoxy-D-manno-octulosonic acid transferase [Capsulimonadaceae bacterium]|nr:3-deoxy-D-manno-octulosonic acid transferase [Capsulimonadaceae bacterium]
MYLLYTILLTIWLVAMAPVLWWRAVFKKKALPGLAQRAGRLPDALRGDGRETIWIHACSVGETLSIQPLVEALTTRYPDARLVISTITAGGQNVARERYAKYAGDGIFYFPIDLPGVVRRVLDFVQPSILVIVDTEIWPNTLREARRRNIPVVLVNGRISAKSFRWYRYAAPLLAPVLACYDAILVKDQVDGDRFRLMGAPGGRLRVSGNMKYDVAAKDISSAQRDALDEALGITSAQGPLIVAGSTHEGEDEVVLAALRILRKAPETSGVRLLLAPRHIERAASVAALARAHGFSVSQRSSGAPVSGSEVLLLDTHGELAAAYQFGDVAFVGGTIAPAGGHSIMEPALFGKPIVVGPHMENFGNMVDEFLEADAIVRLTAPGDVSARAEEMAEAFSGLLSDAERAQKMGKAAQELFEKSKGATATAVETIDRVWDASKKANP